MAAFDPATIRMQREQLRETNAQHKRDLNQLRKFKPSSKSKMAEALRGRISEAVRVSRDLERLIAFMQGANEAHEAAVEQAQFVERAALVVQFDAALAAGKAMDAEEAAELDDEGDETRFSRAQLDGEACTECGVEFAEGEPTVPSGYDFVEGQIFAHAACAESGAGR